MGALRAETGIRRLGWALLALGLFCAGGFALWYARGMISPASSTAQPSGAAQETTAKPNEVDHDGTGPTAETRQVRDQSQVVESVLQVGGCVYYDYQVVAGDQIDPNKRPPGPTSLHDRLGKDDLHDVVAIDLRGPQVTNGLLPHLSSLPKLRWLVLRGTGVSDAGLEQIKALGSLRSLSIEASPITDAGMVHLSAMKEMRTLGLAHTGVTDAGLDHLKSLTQLEVLDLAATGVTDRGMAGIKPMKGLRRLGLRNCQITDAGLAELKNMPHLEYIDLWYTRVTASGIKEFKRALPAVDIPYTGTDPSELGNKQ